MEKVNKKQKQLAPYDLVVTTAIIYYVILNGKCAWCNKDATNLPASHFEQHDKEDRESSKERSSVS